MALLTIPSITKGTAASVSLSKSELFALSAVAADAYFSVQSNVKRCVIELNSDPGNQRKILQFDLSQASPSASLLISATGRDSYLLERLVLEDYDGGVLILERSELPSGLDVTIGGGGGGLTVSSGLYSWFKAGSLSLSNGASVTSWSDESGSVGSQNMTQDGALATPVFQASAINSLPAVRNTASGVLKMTRAFPTNSSTIFIVAKGLAGATERGALYSEQNSVGAGSTALALTHKADNIGKPLWAYYSQPFAQPELLPAVGENPFICVTECDYNVSVKQYLNGTLAATTNGGAMSGFRTSSVYLFNFFSWYFKGDIAEFIIYDRVLTATERNQVTQYLSNKYAITVS